MNRLDPLAVLNLEQRTQRYCAEQNYYATNVQAMWVPPERFRPRSIDPTQKLTDKAARLLSLNHLLSAA